LSRSLLPLSSAEPYSVSSSGSFVFFFDCARAHSKQAIKKEDKRTRRRHTSSSGSFVFHSLLLHLSITSNPIHELRLNQNVTNTVIALTIRVIYLSLIITLKRGVVVLWFTVTCPLSSGFLPTILPAEQFLSPKTTEGVPHTHQALTNNKNKETTKYVSCILVSSECAVFL